MFRLAIEYLGLTFLANLGVLQLAALHNKLYGLSIFKKTFLTYIFAFITIIIPLAIFFLWNNFNETGVIEGAQQSYLFFGSLILALLLTLIVSSLVHRKDLRGFNQAPTGLNALKTSTYFQSTNIIPWKKR